MPVVLPIDRRDLERAFARARRELGVRTRFPAAVLREAHAAAQRGALPAPSRAEAGAVPFLTVDPPGSRDLDQALHLERAGEGYRVRYAIADVGAWVARGGAVEREAWLRGSTVYGPERRDPLYPPALSEEAASLLPGVRRPAVLFDLRLDARGELRETAIGRAWVQSRAQLTYADALALAGEVGGSAAEARAPTLPLLREVGELRRQRERERGGVSLPLLSQDVQRHTASRLGYRVVYETPNAAEEWNAQISLLAGHAAALRMLEAGVGLLRMLSPVEPADLAAFRLAARTLGFDWPEETGYASFVHGLPQQHPLLPALVWQARRLMRGSGYLAFAGEPPARAAHAALAMPYAHCTAPLRRLADRYVLDLLVTLPQEQRPTPEEVATLQALPPVMEAAERRAAQFERRVVDVAEAAALAGCVGRRLAATVLGVQRGRLEVQLEEPPVRTLAAMPAGREPPALGGRVAVRVQRVDVPGGRAELTLEPRG